MFASTSTWFLLKGLLLWSCVDLILSVTVLQSSISKPYTAPMEFPKNESAYPFVHNSTILKVLTALTSNETLIEFPKNDSRLSFKHNDTILKILESETSNQAKVEFPKNESGLPFMHNSTILKILTDLTKTETEVKLPKNESAHNGTTLRILEAHTGNDTEVYDLLHGGFYSNISHSEPSKTPPISKDAENSTSANRKWDSQLIENGSETEDIRKNVNCSINTENRDFYGSQISMVQGQLAVVLACTFVLIAAVAYGGLLLWKRLLEIRYGNRAMLINEEDFYDPNDMRHFSL